MSDSISALLEALKRKEAGAGTPDSAAAPEEGMDSPMMAPQEADPEEAAENQQVVDILQTDYPEIYAKIMKQVGSPDETESGDEMPMDSEEMPSSMASKMPMMK